MTAASLPPRRRSAHAGLWTALRLLAGLALLVALAYFMWTPGDWPTRLFAWVLLTILADECAGWFGYAGLAMGALAFFAPSAPPEQWTLIVPLVGGALGALLLLKHSGGPLVLPFAAVIFAGALYATGRFGLKIDPELTLPANATFQRSAVLPMLIALAFSFVRQYVGVAVRYARRRRAARAATPVSVVAPATVDSAVPSSVAVDSVTAPAAALSLADLPLTATQPTVSLDKAAPDPMTPGSAEGPAVPTTPPRSGG